MVKATEPQAHLLRVATTRLDGATVFGSTPKDRWESFLSPDRQNRVAIGNYVMLLPHKDGWVLVNTGPGDKSPASIDIAPTRGRSSLLRDLREMGISPRDISVVVLTHLHSEHAGGSTHDTSSGRILPTFPNARHIVQRDAWEEATRPSERHRSRYRADDFLPLEENGQLELVDGCQEVVDGIWVMPACGPTAGHQAVRASTRGSTVLFMGILVPTLMHLTPGVVSAADRNPDGTLLAKQALFREALDQGWLMGSMGIDRWVHPDEITTLSIWRCAMGQEEEDDSASLRDLTAVAV